MVASRAMVRDLFDVKDNAKVFSTLMLVIAVSPIIAPTLGGFITGYFGTGSACHKARKAEEGRGFAGSGKGTEGIKMIHGILFGLVIMFLIALFEFIENRMRKSQQEKLKFILDHKSAKQVLARHKYFCKCGKKKRISQVVCEECYRDGRE